jgi:uncharacterized protein YigE (DUF2233 family)
MAAIRYSLLVAAGLVLASCEAEPEPSPPRREQVVAAHCEQRSFEGSAFTACRYDARTHDLELVLDRDGSPLRSLAALDAHLGGRGGQLLFAMNAGMYDERGMPIGLYVENGRRRHAINLRDGPGNFHLKPNGVFGVDRAGRVVITRSEDWRRRHASARWATQSGPLLVIDGALHPRITANGESLNIRNGVGVADTRTAWFAISDDPVSFGRLARFFRDALGCRDALYLDGTVSSLWDPKAGRQDAYDSLGPIVAVFMKPAPARGQPRRPS